jgi:hypothetical protein
MTAVDLTALLGDLDDAVKVDVAIQSHLIGRTIGPCRRRAAGACAGSPRCSRLRRTGIPLESQ